jgi:hypothetical protein
VASPTRWTRPRRSRLILGPALVLAVAAAAAGCSSSPAATTSTGRAASAAGSAAASAALTTAQAREIFDAYVATTARAARAGDPALALSVVTGVQQSTLTAALKSSVSFPSALGYTYGAATFYLPEPAGYPRFFVTAVTRARGHILTQDGTPPAEAATTSVGGAEVPVNGRVLMVFQQESATARWLLSSLSQLPAGATVPQLATDSGGHVPQVPLSATTLLARWRPGR